jgi:hypothetical protein
MRSTLAREAVAVSRASDTVVHQASSLRKRPTRRIFKRPVFGKRPRARRMSGKTRASARARRSSHDTARRPEDVGAARHLGGHVAGVVAETRGDSRGGRYADRPPRMRRR